MVLTLDVEEGNHQIEMPKSEDWNITVLVLIVCHVAILNERSQCHSN